MRPARLEVYVTTRCYACDTTFLAVQEGQRPRQCCSRACAERVVSTKHLEATLRALRTANVYALVEADFARMAQLKRELVRRKQVSL